MKENTYQQILEERRKGFTKIYKETFGEEPDFEKAEKENTHQIYSLNIYGLKSEWM